ncbi:MAG: hypothetical protein JW742_06220, partial [Candidatus Aminicenantes bacterium]|nr:hypothetical protein [Candidatus Aminicenantes bacterium]
MNSNRIDLVFEPTPGSASPPQEALLTVAGMKSQARLVYYPRSKGGAVLARADLSVPLDVRWRDAVDLSAPRGGGPIGRGRVLHPQAPKLGRVRMARRTPLLELLLGDDA